MSDDRSRFRLTSETGADEFVPTSVGIVRVHRVGSGAPLVLLHANGQSWREFSSVVDPLAEQYEVFAWDMPGHGESDPAPLHTSIEGYAAVLKEVLDRLGVGAVNVAGTSVGAFIAMAFENAHPEQVSGLGLVEFQFITERLRWEAMWGIVEKNFAVPVLSRDEVQARLSSEVDDELVSRWNIDRSRAGSRTMMDVMWAIRAFDAAGSARSLSRSPVVVFGQDSPTVGGVDALTDALPDGARFTLVPKCGHFVATDAPDTLIAELGNLGPDR